MTCLVAGKLDGDLFLVLDRGREEVQVHGVCFLFTKMTIDEIFSFRFLAKHYNTYLTQHFVIG